jgi:hypothetical protein
MFNAIWPTADWGTVEYSGGPEQPGQVLGGRWRPTHYQLRASTFADQLATCNSGGACFVTNSAPFAFNGTVAVRLLNTLSGKSAQLTTQMLGLPPGPGVTEWFCAEDGLRQQPRIDADSDSDGIITTAGPPPPLSPPPPCPPPPPQLACSSWANTIGWQTTGCDANGTNCVLEISAIDSAGARMSHNVNLFVAPKHATLPEATVSFKVGASGDITLTTTATALYVVLTTAAVGRFSDNAILLEAGVPQVIDFVSWNAGGLDAAQLAVLRSSLRVEHLQENL